MDFIDHPLRFCGLWLYYYGNLSARDRTIIAGIAGDLTLMVIGWDRGNDQLLFMALHRTENRHIVGSFLEFIDLKSLCIIVYF